jgi:hypothetical protein
MLKDTIKDILIPCLWGASIGTLDINSDKFLIIERILEHGGDKQIQFMMSTYKPEDIIQGIKESSYLSHKTVTYWCLFFNLKKENTKCYTKPFQILWSPS